VFTLSSPPPKHSVFSHPTPSICVTVANSMPALHQNLQQSQGFAMSYAQTHYKSKHFMRLLHQNLQQSQGFAMPYAQTHYKSTQSMRCLHQNLQQSQGFAMPYAQTHYKSTHSMRLLHQNLQQSRGFAMSYAQTHYKSNIRCLCFIRICNSHEDSQCHVHKHIIKVTFGVFASSEFVTVTRIRNVVCTNTL
jgi:SOS response regulatory protein OraA/RecX